MRHAGALPGSGITGSSSNHLFILLKMLDYRVKNQRLGEIVPWSNILHVYRGIGLRLMDQLVTNT